MSCCLYNLQEPSAYENPSLTQLPPAVATASGSPSSVNLSQQLLHKSQSSLHQLQLPAGIPQSQSSQSLTNILSNEIQQAKTNASYALAHGGRVVKTLVGPIQFGIPPFTVQDSLRLEQEVPSYFILPTKRFEKKTGMNVADFEIPCFYNYFIKKRTCTIICTGDQQHAIRSILQETLLGPVSFETILEDYYYSYPRDGIPDFEKELKYFATNNAQDGNETLRLESLVNFIVFDESHTAIIKENDSIKSAVTISHLNNQFHVIENNAILYSFDETIQIPQENLIDANGSSATGNSTRQVTVWNKQTAITKSIQQMQSLNQRAQDESIIPPDFGITFLAPTLPGSTGNTDARSKAANGFIIWIYGKGIMVDPPACSSQYLKSMGIPTVLIHAIIVTHCHSDHDVGTFAKLLEDCRIEVITTRTIMNSFLRKYSAVSGMGIDELKHLFIFRPVTIGTSINIYGAFFRFFYTFHAIPCIGFECHVLQKSLFYSSDTFYHPEKLKDLLKKGVFKQKRYEQLTNLKFNNDLIIHEAGDSPLHTPLSSLMELLPTHIKSKLVVMMRFNSEQEALAHVQDAKIGIIRLAKCGLENSIILHAANAASKHMSTQRRLDLLSSIDIFENLTIKNIKWLLDSVIDEHYLPRQLILKENTIGNKFYIIESGIARVFSNNAENSFERFYQTGEYFGETALMCHGGKRMANVEAVTELTLMTLEKHDFKFIFSDGCGGDGPVIRKFMNLTESRKSKALHVIYKNSVLNELGQSQKTQLEMIVKEEDVEKGQVMWNVGDKATFAFIVKKGTFEFFDCPEHDLDEFESGAFIGEVTAITDNSALTTSVIATRKAKVFKIFKEDLIAFLNKNPGIQVMFAGIKYIE